MTCVICSERTAHGTAYCEFCLNNIDSWRSQLGLLGYKTLCNFDKDYVRSSKDTTFLEIAYLIAKRSPDSQTQHGCVLVKNNRIIATGYNGWNANSNDDLIPNIRPHKYHFVIHAEQNAIYNAAKEGVSVDGAIAYITGHPCTECMKALIQCNIKEWFIGDVGFAAQNDTVQIALRDFLIKHHNVMIHKIMRN